MVRSKPWCTLQSTVGSPTRCEPSRSGTTAQPRQRSVGLQQDRQLEPAVSESIVAALEESGLFDQDRTLEPEGGADLQRYEIRYAGHTVIVYDTTIPEELATAIELLEAAIRSR